MQTARIDSINIALILLSLILAYLFPLELFVVAFITLGPLHYFTEINWLDKKNYFIQGSKRTWFWIGLSTTALIMLPKYYFYLSGSTSGTTYDFIQNLNNWTNAFIFLSLIAAIGFVLIKKRIYWVVLMVPSVICAWFLNSQQTYTQLVGVLIPTVIHVYIFTILFMAYGAKKAKSTAGYIAVGVAILAPLLIAGINLDGQTYLFGDAMKSIFVEHNFHNTPVRTAQFIGLTDVNAFYFYQPLYLKMMMFLSFIYLYHYLNWFSKTSLIQWHKTLTRKRTLLIAGMWVGLMILFYFSFDLAMMIAFFFSFLHVILEFPLNVFSVKGILTKEKSV